MSYFLTHRNRFLYLDAVWREMTRPERFQMLRKYWYRAFIVRLKGEMLSEIWDSIDEEFNRSMDRNIRLLVDYGRQKFQLLRR